MTIHDWVLPLLKLSARALTYRSPRYSPPPKHCKPRTLGATSARTELDPAAMSQADHARYWRWALESATLVLCVSVQLFPAEHFAKKSWDPYVVTNLGANVGSAAFGFARREAETAKRVCCIFRSSGCNPNVAFCAPDPDLEKLFRTFVKHCHFKLRDWERTLAPLKPSHK